MRIEKMSWACSTHGEVRNAKNLPENLKRRDHLGDRGVDWWIIPKCIYY
jgi:hypothetical protein